MALYNLLVIWYWLVAPIPHSATLAFTGNLVAPAPAPIFDFSLTRSWQFGINLNLETTKIGELPEGAGTLGLFAARRLGENWYIWSHLNFLSPGQVYTATFQALGGTRHFVWWHRKWIFSSAVGRGAYYDLHEKYTFFSLNLELLRNYSWGNNWKAVLGSRWEWDRLGFPEEVSTHPLTGWQSKLVAGVAFQPLAFSSGLFMVINRGAIGLHLRFSYSFY